MSKKGISIYDMEKVKMTYLYDKVGNIVGSIKLENFILTITHFDKNGDVKKFNILNDISQC